MYDGYTSLARYNKDNSIIVLGKVMTYVARAYGEALLKTDHCCCVVVKLSKILSSEVKSSFFRRQ